MKRVWVRDQLRQLIDDNPPGALIPSERELSEQLGVSRPTLRAAIEELARDGLLVRHAGRGTFTTVRPVSQPLTVKPPEFAVPPAEGTWLSRVEEFTVAPAGPRLGARLNISPASEALTVRRLRITDDEPMAIEHISLPAELVPGIRPDDFETGSLYQVLRQRFGVAVATAVQTTEATVTDATESTLLEIPVYAPALLFERTTKDTDGRVVEYTRSIYRGDRYRITAQLRLDDSSG
ncbi:GntR family transcriptional regulator [Kineosporia sp. NBRC 101731]|uniref:GntR family transcriptional regulator n=1 Tax=Kineosporia sp. NBRC 101731 TaxID=3032199 RepID=UPI0024A2442B|nr:GntR family transcriptional regulator [Kineosporia sp. NBRC 101731]GLY28020.1 GntR family transcriptional regulator [Kineosporia sp. NBRC 101731]